MNLSIRFALGLVICLGFTAPFASAQEGLRPVGTLTYTPEPAELQTGVIVLRPEDRMIRTMRIEVREGTVDIRDVRLIYRDGQSERFRIRERLRAGAMTGIIRKQGRGPLREVEVSYIPLGKVTLVVRAETRPPEPPPPRPLEWAELGCKNVGFLADRDTVTVGSDELYRALRLRSTGFDIEMLDMVVRFANGQRDIYRINAIIRSGARTAPIDLRGERRRISTIEFTYRTQVLSTRKTQLCVDGLQFSRGEEDDDDE